LTNPVLEAALSYAKLGIPILPCKPKGKVPDCPEGKDNASLNREVIRAWFTDRPDRNIGGLITPAMVVLDIDGPEGERALANNGFVPTSTAEAKTPKGRHLWYVWTGEDSPQRKIGFLPKVDILCNGYVVMPPSEVHGGGKYGWEVPLTKDNLEACPDWLSVAVAENKASHKNIDPEEFFEGLPEGQRQVGLFRYACLQRRSPRMTKREAKILVAALAKASEGRGYKKYPDTDALVDRVWKTYDAAVGVDEKQEESRVWSLSDLLSEVHEPPNYLIDKLLPGLGYTIVFAAQGAGKSVLAGQSAVAITTGTPFLGRQTRRSGVLVLDIEQDPAGAADRWRKLLRGMHLEAAPGNLYTAFSWPQLDDGGFQKIADFVVEHPHVQLIVVDTLAQATSMEGGGGNAYFSDSRAMSKFTRFGNEYGVAFMIISHSRKSIAGSKDNFADMASGTRGITGPAKARWGLTVEEDGVRGKLQIGGKLPAATIDLTFDKEFLLWR
jgi:hypothetical protein